LIGYPLQIVTMVLYPLIYLYWKIFVYEKVTELKDSPHEEITELPRHSAIRDLSFHDNQDDHSALTHWGLYLHNVDAAESGLRKLIDENGAFMRRYRNGVREGFHVSGDAVISWCFAWALANKRFKIPKDTLLKAADHYLKNLGTISNMPEAQGWVSARCNNFGVNYCPDGYLNLGQPAAGPQFYTSSCVFALASQYSFKFKIVFWLHWIFMGGWLWAFAPVLYTKKWKAWYVRDTSMKALYIHLMVFGRKWWIIRPMKFIAFDIAEHQNALFFAMMGWFTKAQLPAVMNPFFSQEPDAASREDGEKTNVWINGGLAYIMNTTRMRE
jgi:hypothetical protein